MRRITRRRGACQACRSRKVRCDGADPCLNCERNSQACYYPPLAPRPRRTSAPTNNRAPPNVRRLEINSNHNEKLPSYDAWQQLGCDNTLLTPNSTDDCGNNSDRGERDDLDCLLQFALPNGSHDQTGMLDMPLPGEDELMELLDTTPSDSNSSARFNFEFASPMLDDKFTASPTLGPSTARETPQKADAETASPADYDMLLNFGNTTSSLISKPSANSPAPERPPNPNDVTLHVDFAASSLYGLPNYIARSSKEPHRTEMIKIVNGLKRVLCGSRAMPNSSKLDRPRRYPDSDSMICRYCDACFEDCCPLSSFLTRPALDRLIKQAREPEANPLAVAFSETTLAIGCYTACQRSRQAPTADEVRDAQRRLASALGLYKTIQGCPNSLLKFQATLVLAVVACMCDESLVWEKITAAVCCARDLRLVHTARGQQPSMGEQEHELAQRSVWFLYNLETEYAIHHGMLPILDLGWGSRFPSFERGDDMVAASYTFSEVLHSVLKFQYSPRALNKSTSAYDRRDRLQASCHVLNEWATGLPAPLGEAHNARTLQGIKDDGELRKALRVFCMYHRAIFFIHCPWITPLSSDDGDPSGVAGQTRERCMERCAESAFAVVKLANSGLFWEKGLERDIGSPSTRWGDMGQLLLVSLCFIVYYLVNGEKGNRKTAMPYLAICGGLFGRLSLESDEASLLDHYLELVQVVRAR
ncbi:Terrein cluster-specific transcription factor terR [Colletotrichum trifolii]|uniref:Terrein cluster-specific transcription factor terR n=1 Tax=Colletotrichum trifolii TaxID=5466 RepID=A0A4R8RC83_COLTR|nr:Terrein cluster-specific transcription factor terR [Colletotrichum trifolii]